MTTGVNLSSLASAMDNADYVLIDGVVFSTEYSRIPDDRTVADDVVLVTRDGGEVLSSALQACLTLAAVPAEGPAEATDAGDRAGVREGR